MILDALLLFTGGSGGTGNNDGRTDTPGAGTTTSSNILYLAQGQTNLTGGLPLSQATPFAAPGRDIGIGDDPAMKLLVQVTVAFNVTASMTVSFQGAPDSGTGTPGSFVTYATGPTILLAGLVVGARLFDIDWPRQSSGTVPPRFVQLSYGAGAGTNTLGRLLGTAVLDRFDQPYDGQPAVTGGYLPGVVIAN